MTDPKTGRGTRPGFCRLHQREELLHESHIVSRTLMKWLKRQGPVRAKNLTAVEEPAGVMSIAQDGFKDYLLCWGAEQLIGRSEQLFRERVFDRLISHPREPVNYGTWMATFGVSLVWRVLEYSRKHAPRWSEIAALGGDEAAHHWRRFLLGEVASPAPFDIHMLPLIGDGVDFENYVNTTIEANLVSSPQGEVYAFAKLRRLLLLGTIRDPFRDVWEGTRIDAVGGVWGGAGTVLDVPDTIATYMAQRETTNRDTLELIRAKGHRS